MIYIFDKHLDVVEKIESSMAYILTFSLIFVIIRAFSHRQWTVLFISTITLSLFYLPAVMAKRFRIHLPIEMQFVIVLFIYASLFLGEIKHYYIKFWWWDVLLHTVSGIGFGFAGFIILYTLYTHQRVKASPLLISVFSFCFAVAIGTVWEIYEFSMDSIFGLNMQKSGLVDTMWDLIVDSVGALFTSVSGFMYIKGGKTHILSRLLRRFMEKNPRIFRSSLNP